jgi:REP element-mobilizing transposase RayT
MATPRKIPRKTKTPARRRRPRKRPQQTALSFRTWGGQRPGAGRKPNGARAGVSHLRRAKLASRHPVHVTLRVVEDVPKLRRPAAFGVIKAGVAAAQRRDFSVVEVSVQGNHLHLLVEASDATALARGMQGLCIRLARRLNTHFRRRGKLWADRYHARVLATPTQVRHALAYVLLNARKHAAQRGHRLGRAWLDPFSSADSFAGWRDRSPRVAPQWVRAPRTWLLRVGWRARGLLGLDEVPGRRGAARA